MAEKDIPNSNEGKEVAKKRPEATSNTVCKFKIEKLRENSMKLFGITTSTFDGAMYGQNAEELTVEEARKIINEWLETKQKGE